MYMGGCLCCNPCVGLYSCFTCGCINVLTQWNMKLRRAANKITSTKDIKDTSVIVRGV